MLKYLPLSMASPVSHDQFASVNEGEGCMALNVSQAVFGQMPWRTLLVTLWPRLGFKLLGVLPEVLSTPKIHKHYKRVTLFYQHTWDESCIKCTMWCPDIR